MHQKSFLKSVKDLSSMANRRCNEFLNIHSRGQPHSPNPEYFISLWQSHYIYMYGGKVTAGLLTSLVILTINRYPGLILIVWYFLSHWLAKSIIDTSRTFAKHFCLVKHWILKYYHCGHMAECFSIMHSDVLSLSVNECQPVQRVRLESNLPSKEKIPVSW